MAKFTIPDWINALSEEEAIKLMLLGFFGTTPPSGSGGGGIIITSESTAEATAATPSYAEGQDAPLSQDLSGHLRTIASIDQTTPGTTNGVAVKNLKGEAGAVIETGTTAITGGDFDSIQCLADTVLASYTSSTLTGDSLVGVTLPAGTIIYGRFSAFTLTSGKVIAYNRG